MTINYKIGDWVRIQVLSSNPWITTPTEYDGKVVAMCKDVMIKVKVSELRSAVIVHPNNVIKNYGDKM